MGEVRDSIALKPHGGGEAFGGRPPGLGWLVGGFLCWGTQRMNGWGLEDLFWVSSGTRWGFVSEIYSRGCFLPTCRKHQEFTRCCIPHFHVIHDAQEEGGGRWEAVVSVVPCTGREKWPSNWPLSEERASFPRAVCSVNPTVWIVVKASYKGTDHQITMIRPHKRISSPIQQHDNQGSSQDLVRTPHGLQIPRS